MNFILFDTLRIYKSLLPLSYTRPLADLRLGILTIAEKWEKHLQTKPSFLCAPHLQTKYPVVFQSDNFYIKGGLCPDSAVLSAILRLQNGEALTQNGHLLAARSERPFAFGELENAFSSFRHVEYQGEIRLITAPWMLFKYCRAEIIADFPLVTSGRQSAEITDTHVAVYGREHLFVEPTAIVLASVINATEGPVYIGHNAQIHEGVLIRGALALCEGAHLNMGAKMRGDSTIGPYCKIGGEVSNSVFWGYSNKAHDGFVGNSVIGQWCNLGADTNTSNLKNNYSTVRVWSYYHEKEVDTGLTFCGLTMGDHSKCGINTMFNTGTVLGVSVNVFGGDFPPKFLPSFAWGGSSSGFTTFSFDKALEVAARAMERRKVVLTQEDKDILAHVFESSKPYRENYILEL